MQPSLGADAYVRSQEDLAMWLCKDFKIVFYRYMSAGIFRMKPRTVTIWSCGWTVIGKVCYLYTSECLHC